MGGGGGGGGSTSKNPADISMSPKQFLLISYLETSRAEGL